MLFQLLEELTAATHLIGTSAEVAMGDDGAVMGGGHRDELIAAIRSTHVLEVIARNQPAHAVADNGEILGAAECFLDLFLE